MLCLCRIAQWLLGSTVRDRLMLGMQGPFTYEALSPADIVFRPLKQTREFNAAELLQVGSLLAARSLMLGSMTLLFVLDD